MTCASICAVPLSNPRTAHLNKRHDLFERLLFYVGDGGGSCSSSGQNSRDYLNDTLELITERNNGRAQINTFGVFMTVAFEEMFLTELAERNGGMYYTR